MRRFCEIGGVAVKSPFSLLNIIIAVSVGVVVLAGYFIPLLSGVRELLLQWAVILAAFALLVGVANLLMVHLKKMGKVKKGGIYSLVLWVAFFITLFIVALDGPNGSRSVFLYDSIQIPVESSLMALLAVTLAVASMRLLRRRAGLFTYIFMATALLVLLGTAPLYGFGEIPFLNQVRMWISDVLSVAGARGILLGVALGTIATGIRVLMGVDRPYGG
jgi:hypothetical protein